MGRTRRVGRLEAFLISGAAIVKDKPRKGLKKHLYVVASEFMTVAMLRAKNKLLERRFSKDGYPYMWWGSKGDLQDLSEGFRIYDAR